MEIQVLLFGILAEKAGETTIIIQGITDIESLKTYMFDRFPEFEDLTFQVSVNKDLIRENASLKDGDEVALLPPFAGG